MLAVVGLARRFFGVRQQTSGGMRRGALARKPSAVEGLERREVLSAVVVAPFASLPGRIASAAQPAQVGLRVAPGQITSDRSAPIYVAIQVQAAPGSAARPQVLDVVGPTGLQYPVNKTPGGPFLLKVTPPALKPKAFEVDVAGLDDKVGDFVLNAYLAGDVDANGTVDASDIQRIKSSYGTHDGMPHYDPAADLNQDGRVGCIDLTMAKANLGAREVVVPVYTAPPVVAPPVRAAVTPAPAPAPAPVAVAPAPLVTVPVQTAPVVPVVYYQPVNTVPVYTQAPAAAVNGQQVALVPVYNYGQAGAQTATYPYGAPAAQPAVYGYAQPGAGYTYPVYAYGQPAVQGPVVATAATPSLSR